MTPDWNQAPTPYPVGTLCEVVYHPRGVSKPTYAEILAAPMPAEAHWTGVKAGWLPAGEPCQSVNIYLCPRSAGIGKCVLPTAWLRPIQDPDAEPVTEQETEGQSA